VAGTGLRLAYNTNGLAHHRLEDALDLLAEAGYDGVGLTLDAHHLDPLRATPAAVARVRRRLDRLGLSRVVETGARFLLDPRRKHRPTLLSREGAERRRDLLLRCIAVARDLGAPVVSTWSGAAEPGSDAGEDLARLAEALGGLADRAEAAGVVLGFEPEPGMFVDTLAGWDALRARLPHRALGLTLDLGHCLCEPGGDPAAAVRARSREIVNVQVSDMRRGVHEHLPFGKGDLDLRACVAALREVRYGGLVGVELSRDSHRAPEAVAESLAALRAAGA
jgi:sugar phosphate isomerase/epimerase